MQQYCKINFSVDDCKCGMSRKKKTYCNAGFFDNFLVNLNLLWLLFCTATQKTIKKQSGIWNF